MAVTHHTRIADKYHINQCDINFFNEFGYLVLPQVLHSHEVDELEFWFDHFIAGKEKHQMGLDFTDTSKPFNTPVNQLELITALLPSSYRPELKQNLFFQIAKNIAAQLYPNQQTELDFECFTAKRPNRKHTDFAMHQDLCGWPKTQYNWTATFSLAITDSTVDNGCLQVIPNSNYETRLRKHKPQLSHDSHTIQNPLYHPMECRSLPHDKIIHLPIKRGDITIHNERIVHGSASNTSPHWRTTYLMSFRDIRSIKQHQILGFSHSRNHNVNMENTVSGI